MPVLLHHHATDNWEWLHRNFWGIWI